MKSIPKENRDLRIYVLRKDLFRAVGFALWMVLWYSGAAAYNHNHQTYPPERQMVGWRLYLWLAIAAITGFLLFRLWKFFTDRTFRGIIKSNSNSRSYSPSQDPKNSAYDFRLNTKLKIEQSDGTTRRIRFEQKNGFYTYYYEGSEIMHLHGLPYPVNLDPSSQNGYVCSACGTWYKEKKDRCDVCNHTIIDPKKLK